MLSLYICVTSVLLCNTFTCFFFFKQKTAYEMRISDWSSDVCSSDLEGQARHVRLDLAPVALARDQIVPSDILDGHFSAFLLFEKPVRAMATAIGLGGTDAQERGERGEQRESPGVVREIGRAHV